MLAAILFKSKQKLRIEEISIPEKLEYGQVLVKIFYSSICGAQLNEIDAAKGKDNFLPHLLGHEGSGKVLKIGKGVKIVRPGDKVVLHWRKGDGIQSETPKYDFNGKRIYRTVTFSDGIITIQDFSNDVELGEYALWGEENDGIKVEFSKGYKRFT